LILGLIITSIDDTDDGQTFVPNERRIGRKRKPTKSESKNNKTLFVYAFWKKKREDEEEKRKKRVSQHADECAKEKSANRQLTLYVRVRLGILQRNE
jgi:hypothetical protein